MPETPKGRLGGRIALISGGSRGQGAAEARLFTAEGAKVVIGDVLDDEGKAVAEELGEAAAYVHLDVRRKEDWTAAVSTATDSFGGLDVLINNAGVFRLSSIEDTTPDDYMSLIEVNQLGVFLGMQAVIAAMTTSGRASIVNISSIDGLVGMAGSVSYVASKFAVRGMTKVAALELGPRGIRVNSIHPGGVDTPMIRDLQVGDITLDGTGVMGKVPLGRIGTPEDVARLALFLASDDSSYCTGSEFTIDGGLLAGPNLF
ncbi:MAG: glucose 1-dehydrogenase [Acidimicrobiales bacterium]|nr:glucose 1-dehydrogenase [Acidimicrobiales bacterium]